jgi:large subunit ribosomal protein L9
LKVILKEYNEKLGDTGDIIDVKAGYANNFLIPNGLAVLASKGNINQMELVKKAEQKVEAKNVEEAQKQVGEIGDLILTFVVKAGEEGKLYGSITNKDIAEKIKEEKNIEVDRKKIALAEHLKEIGEYDVDLKLYKEVKAPIKVIVEPDQESKELIEAHNKEMVKEEAEEKERLKAEEKTKKDKKKEEEKAEKKAGKADKKSGKAEKAAEDGQPEKPEKDKPKGKNK